MSEGSKYPTCLGHTIFCKDCTFRYRDNVFPALPTPHFTNRYIISFRHLTFLNKTAIQNVFCSFLIVLEAHCGSLGIQIISSLQGRVLFHYKLYVICWWSDYLLPQGNIDLRSLLCTYKIVLRIITWMEETMMVSWNIKYGPLGSRPSKAK